MDRLVTRMLSFFCELYLHPQNIFEEAECKMVQVLVVKYRHVALVKERVYLEVRWSVPSIFHAITVYTI